MTIIKSSSVCSLNLSDHPFDLSRSNHNIDLSLSNHHIDLHNERQGDLFNNVFNEETFDGTIPPRRSTPTIFHMIVEEEARQAVSSDRIHMNLIEDATKRANEARNQVYIKNNRNGEEDVNYWDMPSDCDMTMEEKALSLGQVEKLLLEDAVRRIATAKKPSLDINRNCNNGDSYWDWSLVKPVLGSEKKVYNIASAILEKSSLQDCLSLDYITKLEASKASSLNSQGTQSYIKSTDPEVEVYTDYWTWVTTGGYQSEGVASHYHDLTHPNHAYWDFPFKSDDPTALKAQLIEKILYEERIRVLMSSEAIEAREVSYHQTKKASKEEKIGDTEFKEGSSNYWDWNSSDSGNLLSLVEEEEKQASADKKWELEVQRYILSLDNIERNLRNYHDSLVDEDNISLSSNQVPLYWAW